MLNGKNDELNKYVNQIKERPILSRMPTQSYKIDNKRFLYCDPPEVILQSNFFLTKISRRTKCMKSQ